MIFYFTGTGNSLYAAKKLDEERISIPQALHWDNLCFRANKIGIVCPVYGHEVPPLVREFLQKADFQTDYFYMVLTYGNRHGGASELAYQLCRECGILPQYINVVLMADNWPSFDVQEQARMDKKTDQQLASIRQDIEAGKRGFSPVTDHDRDVHRQFLANKGRSPGYTWEKLINITEKCVGCGICTRVCPAGCIQMINGRAALNERDCQTCLACFHACPQRAVRVNMPEKILMRGIETRMYH